jgi:DNA processing protein
VAEPAEPPDELAAWLSLSRTPGLEQGQLLALLREFGLPEQVLSQSRNRLSEIVGREVANAIKAAADPASLAILLATRSWLAQPNRSVLSLADRAYPPLLLHQEAAPALLFVDGDASLLRGPWLALIAPAGASRGAIDTAVAFSRALLDAGIALLSPFGTPFSHAVLSAALSQPHSTECCRFAAVLEHGPERIAPAHHLQLAREVAARGALVSDFAPGEHPPRGDARQAHGLLAALPAAVLVVEAGIYSREYQTARLAGVLGREIFAIPGSIHAPLARGCHRLIKDGARLVERVEDIIEEAGQKLRERALT